MEKFFQVLCEALLMSYFWSENYKLFIGGKVVKPATLLQFCFRLSENKGLFDRNEQYPLNNCLSIEFDGRTEISVSIGDDLVNNSFFIVKYKVYHSSFNYQFVILFYRFTRCRGPSGSGRCDCDFGYTGNGTYCTGQVFAPSLFNSRFCWSTHVDVHFYLQKLMHALSTMVAVIKMPHVLRI